MGQSGVNGKWLRTFVRQYLWLGFAIATFLWAFATLPTFAVQPATAHPPPTQPFAETPANLSLLERGQQHYQAGQLQQAVTLWQQSAEQAIDWRQQVTALNYLGLVYQELGQWLQAEHALENALAILDTHSAEPHLYGNVLTTQGSWQLHQGQAQRALETWQTAEQLYQSVGAVEQQVRSQINQAQALRSLGFYRQALDLLEQAIATPFSDDRLKARSLHSLGITLRAIGQLERAQQVLGQALTLVQDRQTSDWRDIQLSLAHTLRDAGDLETALASYKRLAQGPLGQRLRVEVTLQQIALHHSLGNSSTAAQLIDKALPQLNALSPSRWGVYAQINLAEQLLAHELSPVSLRLLAQAVRQARELADSRAEAYALGQLGHRYELAGQPVRSVGTRLSSGQPGTSIFLS